MISFEEFKKLELRIGRIIEADRVQGSTKLLKLKVDAGSEIRQIVAGIGNAYEPETLLGKEVVIVANLERKALMGLESEGMADAEAPVLLVPEGDVTPGSAIR